MASKDLRKGLSKELMYKKIMPTANRPETADTDVKSEKLAESAPAITTKPLPEATDNAAKAIPAAISITSQTKANREITEQPDATTEPDLVNIMEYLVFQRVDEVMAKFNCCNCDKCRKDTIALALNKLPPRYMVRSGDLTVDYTRNKSTAEVLTALVQAVLVVRANPRHDDEE